MRNYNITSNIYGVFIDSFPKTEAIQNSNASVSIYGLTNNTLRYDVNPSKPPKLTPVIRREIFNSIQLMQQYTSICAIFDLETNCKINW